LAIVQSETSFYYSYQACLAQYPGLEYRLSWPPEIAYRVC
jgi:hypothetical protein